MADTNKLYDFSTPVTFDERFALPVDLNDQYRQQSTGINVLDKLIGAGGQERVQTWPEKLVRGALQAPQDAMAGKTSEELIPGAMDMAGFAGGGLVTGLKDAVGAMGGKLVQPTIEAAKPRFYSALEKTVNEISQPKMTGEQWLGTIANKGVKGDEVTYTGLKDWLGEQKGPVSKEAVQNYLNENKIQLGETNKIDKSQSELKDLQNKRRELNQNLDEIQDEFNRIDKIPESNDLKAKRLELYNKGEAFKQELNLIQNKIYNWLNMPNATKYSKYQLPGGENYREVLMTLPDKVQQRAIQLAETENGKGSWDRIGGGGQEHYWRDARKELGLENQYKSSHWNELNVVAHLRMNDRMIDNKKSLHIEEIQSDWHQQGREQGYKITDAQKQQLENIDNKLTSGLSEKDIGNPDMNDVLKTATDKKIITPEEANNYKEWSKGENSNIPDAPFKKTWTELALKRAISEAAEKGYDRLSWTPGEAQAARYDLSKQVDKLTAQPLNFGSQGIKYEIKGYKGENDNVYHVATESELPNVVGKEMAKKIISESEGKKLVTYTGLDLKVGGEGMKGYYDQIVPKAVEKLTGEKVKSSELPNNAMDAIFESKSVGGYKIDNHKLPKEAPIAPDFFETKQAAENWIKKNVKGQPVHYIDIPQSLRDKAAKGFPLFSTSPVLVPVDHDPFKHKLTPIDYDPFAGAT
jgi:hypothetical protein